MDGNINALKYINIFDNNLWPVIARHFPDGNYTFMDDNAFVHRKVQVGKDQEKAQSEKDSHSKNRGGKKPN